jgi:hypothetical protein
MTMSWFFALAVVLLLSAVLVYTNAEAAAQDELALTPFGYWPAACVHSAPNGSSLSLSFPPPLSPHTTPHSQTIALHRLPRSLFSLSLEVMHD